MTTLQITFVSENASYESAFGWYNSRTGEAGIIFRNTNDDGPRAAISAGTSATIDVDQADIDAGNIGFFLIPNGADIYGKGKHSALNGPLSFETKPNGDGQILDARGRPLTGEQGQVIFSDSSLNKKNADYTKGDDNADGILGRIGFEDQVKKGDRDYNDLVVDVKVVNANLPPVIEDQALQIAENSAAGTPVGQIVASDPDAGQSLSYAIVSGNENGAFAIDAATGAITVADASKLDFETPALSSYALTVKATDNGTGALTDTAIVNIGVTDAPPIIGTPGDDNLVGTSGDDVILAGLGNDLLRGGADNDVLNGGVVADSQSDDGVRDTDRADYSAAAGAVNVNLAGGTAQDGDGGTDTLIGVEGVIGSAHNDVLAGGSAAFVEFFRGGAGNDTIDGGSWNDRAEYMDATAGISVNPVALSPNTRTVTGDASVGTDTLINVEIVYGTDFADTYNAIGFLSASQPSGVVSNFNTFEGRGGNDSITGNGGTRIEFTGATAGVTASLATGIATGDASVGTDTFSGVNALRGSSFADELLGGNPLLNGFESFEGRGGNDSINGGQGYDLAVYAFDGAITTGITVNLAAGTVAGDPILTGIDTLRGVEGVRGSHKDDWYDATGFDAFSLNTGSLGPSGTYNDFEGTGGNDTIIGNGNTRIIYTQAREGVSVDLAAGTAVGGASVGTDTILGGIFAVRGSNFDDVLAGSAAGEFFEGRAGNDTIDGAGGFDAAAYDVGVSGGGTFVADPFGNFTASAAGLGTDLLSNIEQITGTNFGDLFDGSASSHGYSFLAQGGNDTLIGSQGFDNLFGGNGDDLIRGGAGNDFIDAGLGSDRIDIDAPWEGVDTIASFETVPGGDVLDIADLMVNWTSYAGGAGGALAGFVRLEEVWGTDTQLQVDTDGIGGPAGWQSIAVLSARIGLTLESLLAQGNLDVGPTGGGGITLIGTPGNDFLDGTPGNDTILADLGNDFLRGRAGNDLLNGGVVADLQSDVGFRDTDRADYSTAPGGVDVNLATGVALDGEGGTDTLSGIEEVNGSAFDDLLTGSSTFRETFHGGAGNDTIDGGSWNDRAEYMDATAGIAVNLAALAPNTGTVTGDASVGTDTLIDVEVVFGSDFADSYVATGFSSDSSPGGVLSAFNSFEGRAGNDTIVGNGSTRLEFTGATAGITANLATGIATGDASVGTDSFSGVNSVRGSNFADTLLGGNPLLSGFESFDSRGGNDYIDGGQGFDLAVYAFDGTIATGIAVDLAAGTVAGDPVLTGIDTLRGVEGVRGSHKDDWYDATGFDAFSLNAGSAGTYNEFDGGAGNDTIIGNGNTRIIYAQAREGVSVDLAAGTAVGGASVGTDTILGGIFGVRGSNFDDVLVGSAAASEFFEGRAGNDTIDGAGGFDTAAYDVGVSGGGTFVADPFGNFTASAAGLGTDLLSNIEQITGTNFGDLFDGSASALGYTFDGRGGDDTLIGSQGVDTLIGGLSNDLLRGGLGADFLNGGAGADRYDFESPSDGIDAIFGFEAVPGGDVLDIADLMVNWTSYAGGAGGPLASFVRLDAAGPDPVLQVDTDGFGGPAGWQTLGILLGSSGLTLDSLLAQGNLDVGPTGGGGGITLIGTSGNDFLDGSPGNDTILADLGSDFLRGGGGNDLLNGGIVADLQSDAGWRDTDRIDYSTAPEGVNVNLSTGIALDGEGGTDTLIGIEWVDGSPFDDMLFGSSAFQEYFQGGTGDDTIYGSGGFDRALYTNASSGVAIYLGSLGGLSDATGTVAGDATVGVDTLLDVEQYIGSNFADTFNVGLFLSGSSPGGIFATFNSFEGRGGDDVILGNGGTRIEYVGANGAVHVDLNTGVATGNASVGTDTFSGVNAVRGSSFADTLLGGNFATNELETFDGRGGNDFIDGGQGWDRVDYGFNGAVGIGITAILATGTVTGDPLLAGIDTLRGIEAIRGTHLEDLYDATGFSEFSTNAGWNGTLNSFEGLAGNDTIIGNGSTRANYSFAREGVSVDLQAGTALGGASVGSDTILGGVNAVRGSNFDDLLTGSASNDILEGLSGNDLLRGGLGADLLEGGAGADRYYFNNLSEAGDTVAGFEAVPGGDVLDIADLLAASTSYAGGTGGALADFVRLQVAGSDSQLQIDADGSFGGGNWETLATLLGGSGLDLGTLQSGGNLDILI